MPQASFSPCAECQRALSHRFREVTQIAGEFGEVLTVNEWGMGYGKQVFAAIDRQKIFYKDFLPQYRKRELRLINYDKVFSLVCE